MPWIKTAYRPTKRTPKRSNKFKEFMTIVTRINTRQNVLNKKKALSKLKNKPTGQYGRFKIV